MDVTKLHRAPALLHLATADTATLAAVTGNGRLVDALSSVEATPLVTWEAVNQVVGLALGARKNRQRVFFIGNGGSAGISSHMAADWLKAGHFAAMCFNDPALLTCFANDLGYPAVFAKPLEQHGRAGDLLFAISSSGRSLSITDAVSVASDMGMKVVTLSGFKPDNFLRSLGSINFYVPSERYGIVEVAHHAILHAILDRITEG